MRKILQTSSIAKLGGYVEYTDCIYAEGQTHPNSFHTYKIERSDGEAPALAILKNVAYPFIAVVPKTTMTQVVACDRVQSMGQIEQPQ